jgi:hypothetical protein
MIKIEVQKFDFGEIAADLIKDADNALEQTMEDLRQRIIDDEVIPYSDEEVESDGTPHIHMQETMDRVEHIGDHKYSISVEKPYAARVYFGDDMNFNRANNRNAKARFFDEYGPNGSKVNEMVDDFYKHLKE